MMWQIWGQMQVCLIPKPDTLTTILSCFGGIALHSGFDNKGCLFCQVRRETRFSPLPSFPFLPFCLLPLPSQETLKFLAFSRVIWWPSSGHSPSTSAMSLKRGVPSSSLTGPGASPLPATAPAGPPAAPPLLLEAGQQCQVSHADTTPPRARRVFHVF